MEGPETSAGEQFPPSEKQDRTQGAQLMTQETSTARAQRSGGPRTKQGKERSRHNAVKHGLVARGLTELDDSDAYESLVQRLMKAKRPVGDIEKFCVRRIAFHMTRLERAEKLEAEFITGELHPRLKGPSILDILAPETQVIEPGLPAAIGALSVVNLVAGFQRYEGVLENKLYRAIHELERLQRMRRGENVPAPQALDLSVHSGPENVISSARLTGE